MTVLGSSGMFATAERASSGYLVETRSSRVWMDAGAGTWRRLMKLIDYASIDAIVLTHRHPDHTSDVFQAYHARQYGKREPLPTIPVLAPGETIERIDAFIPGLEDAFEPRTIAAGDKIHLGGAEWSFFEMAHPAETVGIRVECDGGAVAYSADSGPEADFASLTAGVDVFMCEATLQDSDAGWEGHLQASQAGRVARSCGVPDLLLTHLPPGRDLDLSAAQARAGAGDGVHVRLAADGMRMEFGA